MIDLEAQKPTSIAKAAALLDVSPPYLYKLAQEKKIRVVRFGRRVLIPHAELNRLQTEGL